MGKAPPERKLGRRTPLIMEEIEMNEEIRASKLYQEYRKQQSILAKNKIPSQIRKGSEGYLDLWIYEKGRTLKAYGKTDSLIVGLAEMDPNNENQHIAGGFLVDRVHLAEISLLDIMGQTIDALVGGQERGKLLARNDVWVSDLDVVEDGVRKIFFIHTANGQDRGYKIEISEITGAASDWIPLSEAENYRVLKDKGGADDTPEMQRLNRVTNVRFWVKDNLLKEGRDEAKLNTSMVHDARPWSGKGDYHDIYFTSNARQDILGNWYNGDKKNPNIWSKFNTTTVEADKAYKVVIDKRTGIAIGVYPLSDPEIAQYDALKKATSSK